MWRGKTLRGPWTRTVRGPKPMAVLGFILVAVTLDIVHSFAKPLTHTQKVNEIFNIKTANELGPREPREEPLRTIMF